MAADWSTDIGFPRDTELLLFANASGLWSHLSLSVGTGSEALIYMKYNLPSVCIYKPRELLVTATWRVLRLPIKETACRCGEQLQIYLLSSCIQPTRGGPPDLGLNDELATSHRKKNLGGQIIWNDLTNGEEHISWNAEWISAQHIKHWLHFAFFKNSRKNGNTKWQFIRYSYIQRKTSFSLRIEVFIIFSLSLV
jgi:hypothetical protein